MSNRDRILWITRTAVFLALLLLFQFVTRSLSQYVTGTLVNFVLITSVMAGGLISGITVALLSPLLAFLLGIGPANLLLIPFIILGNVSIVLVWHFIAGKREFGIQRYGLALISGAVTKFLVLYLSIVQLALPFLLNVPEPQAAVMSVMFSYPQLITAATGGVLAAVVTPLLNRAVFISRRNSKA